MMQERIGGAGMQALLDLLPDTAILVDREGRIVQANQQAEVVFGYGSSELLNQPVEVLMPERFRQQHVGERQRYVLQPTKRVMGQRGVELWGRRKDGSEFPVDIAIGPFEAAGNGPLVLAVIRDMNERKVIETVLRESEERLRVIVDTARDTIISAGKDGRITSFNKAAEQMFGYVAADVLGQPLTVLMPERFREAHTQGMKRFTSTGESRVIGQLLELVGLKRDGQEFPIELSLATWKIGADPSFTAIIRDVTERHHREQALSLRVAALNAAANAILLTARDGTIQWANLAFTTLTGYTPEEAVGKNPRFLKSGQHDQTVYQTLWQTILGGRIWRGELTNRRKDGGLYIQELTITPVRDEDGQITHFIGVSQDITTRKQAEEIVKKEKEELRKMNQIMMGREERIVEMKQEVNALLKELNRPPKYNA
jgi:PAS domain S-box-containing protein